jgi:hypothetical protein
VLSVCVARVEAVAVDTCCMRFPGKCPAQTHNRNMGNAGQMDLLAAEDTPFTLLPEHLRHVPARTPSISVRFHIDKFVEHRTAVDALKLMIATGGRGAGTRALVKALLTFKASGAADAQHPEFAALKASKHSEPARQPKISARLLIDKFVEHREAYEFLKERQELYRDGAQTIIRALNALQGVQTI